MPTPINCGSFTVSGIPFADWFNITIVGKPDFREPIDGDQFVVVFDHVSDLWSETLTPEQFVAFFSIFYNETGGSLKPVSEMGGPRYCFETNGGKKRSYNTAPNRLAGDQLVERGVISEPGAWNGKVWPGGDEAVLQAARECDFYKFRGRGLIQTTWRSNYERDVDPLLVDAGFGTSDSLSTDDLDRIFLTTPSVYLGAVRAFFRAMPVAVMALDRRKWAPVGTHVSGSTQYGTGIYSRRCGLLISEMERAG